MTDRAGNPRRREGLEGHELDGELILHDPVSGQAHVLNPTARMIWDLCDGEMSWEEIADTLLECFPGTGDRLRADVDRVRAELAALKLLESGPAPKDDDHRE